MFNEISIENIQKKYIYSNIHIAKAFGNNNNNWNYHSLGKGFFHLMIYIEKHLCLNTFGEYLKIITNIFLLGPHHNTSWVIGNLLSYFSILF